MTQPYSQLVKIHGKQSMAKQMNKQSKYHMLRQYLMQKIAYDSKQEEEAIQRLKAQEAIIQRLGLTGQVNFVGAFGNKPGIAVRPDGKTAIDPLEQVALNNFLASTAPLRTTGQPGYQGGQGVTGTPPAMPPPAKPPVSATPTASAKPPVSATPTASAKPAIPASSTPPPKPPVSATPTASAKPPKPVVTKPKGIPSGTGGAGIDDP